MSPAAVSSTLLGPLYEVAVAKKVLSASKEQGQQALQLIQSAAAPAVATPQGAVGHLIDIRA
ncbi:MAG TPA: hypothetical protein VIM73_11580 [Polyangiaceae bacterium]